MSTCINKYEKQYMTSYSDHLLQKSGIMERSDSTNGAKRLNLMERSELARQRSHPDAAWLDLGWMLVRLHLEQGLTPRKHDFQACKFISRSVFAI